MPKLIISAEGTPVREIELEPRSYTIGRKPGNDIHIDDSTVSGSHARLIVTPVPGADGQADIRIEDLASTNGTLVNGRKISKTSLRGGDKLLLGSCEIELHGDDTPGHQATAPMTKDGRQV